MAFVLELGEKTLFKLLPQRGRVQFPSYGWRQEHVAIFIHQLGQLHQAISVNVLVRGHPGLPWRRCW